MRRNQVLMSVVGLGSVGALLLAQPDPGGGLSCIKDKTPVPGACAEGAGAMNDDPNCTQAPEIVTQGSCPTVDPSLTGFSEAFPQGTAECQYRYYMLMNGECVLSATQFFFWPCKAAGGTSCGGGGGGNE